MKSGVWPTDGSSRIYTLMKGNIDRREMGYLHSGQRAA